MLFTLLMALIVIGVIMTNKNSVSTTETKQIDAFLASAGIAQVADWKIYPDCGDAGGRDEGYLLRVDNYSVTPEQAFRLKSLAKNAGYALTDRDDGYVIVNTNWNIIVLNNNRADLFITIWYNQKPQGFSEGSQFCS